MATQKTETRMERGICLFRERGHEIVEVEPGIFRVPASEGGGFYRVDIERQRCECADRAPVCKHLFAATILAAKKRCRRATDRPQRRHGQPREDQRGRSNNTPERPGVSAPQRSEEGSLRGAVPLNVAMAGLDRMEG